MLYSTVLQALPGPDVLALAGRYATRLYRKSMFVLLSFSLKLTKVVLSVLKTYELDEEGV